MTTHNQHLVIIAGKIANVVDIPNDDVEAYKAANYAMPEIVVIIKHVPTMKLKVAVAESIAAAKKAGIM